METFCDLHYKLRMTYVPILVASYMYGENMSVLHNTQLTESALKKNNNSIFYYAIS